MSGGRSGRWCGDLGRGRRGLAGSENSGALSKAGLAVGRGLRGTGGWRRARQGPCGWRRGPGRGWGAFPTAQTRKQSDFSSENRGEINTRRHQLSTICHQHPDSLPGTHAGTSPPVTAWPARDVGREGHFVGTGTRTWPTASPFHGTRAAPARWSLDSHRPFVFRRWRFL